MPDAGPSPILNLVQQPGAAMAPGVPTPDTPDAQLNGLASGGANGPPSANPLGALSGLIKPQGQAPAPTHEMTKASLRHFSELRARLGKLLSDPNLGKSNMRPAIFDVAASMLGDGFMTMPRLMNEIKSIPQDPADQKKWLQKHYDTATKAQGAVFDHHRAAFPGSGDWRADLASLPAGGGMDHASVMDATMKHYQQGAGARR